MHRFVRYILYCAIVLFELLYGFEHNAVVAQGTQITVATWNVNYGGHGRAEAIDVIKEIHPDIIALQETTPEWEALLRKTFGKDYLYTRFHHSGGAGGMGLLSKFPFKENNWHRPQQGWFHGWIVECETDIGVMQLLAVHLKPPLSEKGTASVSAYVSAGSTHKSEMDNLYSLLRNGQPTIVLGNFNESDDGKALQLLKQKGFRDALSEFDKYNNTWQWETSTITLKARYDHIVYSSDLSCKSTKVLKKGFSDHYPVIAVFEKKR